MARQASISRNISFVHVPRTPVLDHSGRWTYQADPSTTVLNSTLERLTSNDTKVTEAKTIAQQAQTAAASANTLAQSKATAEEALEEVREQLFYAYDQDGNELVAERMEFRMDEDGWQLSFFTHEPGSSSGHTGTGHLLSYPTLAAFRALQDRVAELESKVSK